MTKLAKFTVVWSILFIVRDLAGELFIIVLYLITNMAETENVKDPNMTEIDAEGLTFPIHKVKEEAKQGEAQSPQELAPPEKEKLDSYDKSVLPEERCISAVNRDPQYEMGTAIEEMEVRFLRRLGRRPPNIVEITNEALSSVFQRVQQSIEDEPTVMEFILSKIPDDSPELLAKMISGVSCKVFRELQQGVVLKDFWERQVDHIENKLKQVQGRDHQMKALFNRHEIKELEEAKRLEANEFSQKMQTLAKEKALKRKEDFHKREYEIMLRQREEAERIQKIRDMRVNKHHAKALSSLESLKDRKKHRYRLYIEGINRQKQIDKIRPYYLQRNEEFKKQENSRYHQHGRPVEEVEEFLKVKKSYHLTRNKMNLAELLHPGREMSANLKRTNLRSQLLNGSRIESSYLSRKHKNIRFNLSTDPISDNSNIQFAALPRLKIGKR